MRREFDRAVLDKVKQKLIYPYEYVCDFEKFNETLARKRKFHSSLGGKKVFDKEHQHVWN